MKTLNLSGNVIDLIDGGAFHGLWNLTVLDLSNNRIRALTNYDVFTNLNSLKTLQLSNNFLKQIPSMALRTVQQSLNTLYLGSNGIRELKLDDFAELSALEFLDLSRNRIAELPPTVFSRLSRLEELIIDVNLVRKMEESMFEGLQNLKRLRMNDNTILGIPTRALTAIPSLQSLAIGYNRVAAISLDLLQPIRNLHELILDFNLVREIPNGSFRNFSSLQRLSLRGNQISSISQTTFSGLETSLRILDLSANLLEQYPTFERLTKIEDLNLSENDIISLPENAFEALPSVTKFNLHNNYLTDLPPGTFGSISNILRYLYLSDNNIKVISRGVFDNLEVLETLDLSQNELQEIEEVFRNLSRLQQLNLAHNKISTVRQKSFQDMAELRLLNLSHNLLSVFDGGIFHSSHNKLEIIDLSHNHIHYLIPNALSHTPRLTYLDLSFNKMTIFLEDILRDAPLLETLKMQNNHLQQIDSGQFSHAIRLRYLDLSRNQIEAIGKWVWRNSSQVRHLNLRNNKLTALTKEIFNGLACLNLDMSYNNLTSLPAGIFARDHVSKLLSINLAFNQFTRLPLSSLNEQYAALQEMNIANNQISHVPDNANALVNVKRLNLANNPLSEESLRNILSEPKTVQELNIANCGLQHLTDLETPFLRRLNLSRNSITSLRPAIFQRTTLLEQLDLSGNSIRNLNADVSLALQMIPTLKFLDLSKNPIRDIGSSDLNGLTYLEILKLSKLNELGRFDHEAITKLSNLKQLSIYDYPRLGFYDIHGILEAIPALENLEVEIKASVLRDQLHPAFNPRLRHLALYGKSLQNLTTVSFAGLLAPSMDIIIHSTSVSVIPNAIFLPLPTSSNIELSLSNNEITRLGPNILMTLNEKRHQVQLKGVSTNPLHCDCFLKSLYIWIKERILDGEEEWLHPECFTPEELKGKQIWTLREDELTCEKRTTTQKQPLDVFPTTEAVMTPLSAVTTTEGEPDIIYEAPSPKPNLKDAKHSGTLTNMDSMIIGIIVGVVAFVCILIIIICIIKLRHNRIRYRTTPMGVVAGQAPCTCVKGSLGGSSMPMCQCNPNFPPHPHHNGPPSVKILTLKKERISNHSQMGQYPTPPYYIAYPESEHEYR